MRLVPKAIAMIETQLTTGSPYTSSVEHNGNQLAFVVDPVGMSNQHDQDDLLLRRHPLYPAATRFSGSTGIGRGMDSIVGLREAALVFGESSATSRSARRAVADGVNQLGGVTSEWSEPNLVVGQGEFGIVDRGKRWVLTVSVDYDESEDSDDSEDEREGIKRIRSA